MFFYMEAVIFEELSIFMGSNDFLVSKMLANSSSSEAYSLYSEQFLSSLSIISRYF